MGSSKKHKHDKSKDKDKSEKEHKRKRKHKSRSRSRDRDGRKKEKKRKEKDRHEKPIVIDDEEFARNYFEDGEIQEHEESVPVPHKKESAVFQPVNAATVSDKKEASLSIEETNRIRAKLGLKPLDVGGDASGKSSDGSKPAKKEDVHVPAVNLSNIKKSDELREKMLQMREKRRINMKLGKVKTLGDSESDDDISAVAWVKKNRKLQEQKQKADKQAKLLEEMDAEFGIGDLVDEEFGVKKEAEYGSRDLRGLKVEHGQDTFKEGKTVILTLKDKGVLEDDELDTLVNVNMIDDEIAARNVDNKKKKPEYKPYDEPEYDEYGMLQDNAVLDKYDEEIDGIKREAFHLGSGGKYDAEQERRMQQIKREIQQKGETLSLPPPLLAAEYMTQAEAASFKKVKKKVRKIRKKPKMVTADDLMPLGDEDAQNLGSRSRQRGREGYPIDRELPMKLIDKSGAIPGLDLVETEDMDTGEIPDESDNLGPEEDLTGVAVEDDEAGLELESALKKARKLKCKKNFEEIDKKLAESIISKRQDDEEMEEEAEELRAGQRGRNFSDTFSAPLPVVDTKGGLNIILNSTSEFCRSLGEIQNYGMAGNRPEEEEDELVEFEKELTEQRRKQMEDDESGRGWQSVQIDTRPVEILPDEKAVLDDEPILNEGIGAALSLAGKKGYLENENIKIKSAPRHTVMEAQNYSIEDKRYDDLDEKFARKQNRYSGGAIMDFKDKDTYKPDVKLEYVDDTGRVMNPKEAFRYLSHRFHGKGSGKKKLEKRQKKLEEEQLMKSMSSTDTPLGTVELLQSKQEKEHTPYIILSGSGKGAATSIAK